MRARFTSTCRNIHDFSLKVDGLITSPRRHRRIRSRARSNFNGYERRGRRTQLQWKPAPNFTGALCL